MAQLSEKMFSLLQRLAEMFPATYQSRMEQYIMSKNPQSAADVEYWSIEYGHQRH